MTSNLDSDSDEQEELAKHTLARAISLELIEQIEPNQVEATDFVIDDLIDLAEQGGILPRGSETAFGFGGLDLIAQFIVPAVVAALTTLVLHRQNIDTQSSYNQHSDQKLITEHQLTNIAEQANFSITSRQAQEITRLINILVNHYLRSDGTVIYQPSKADIDSQIARLEAYRQTLKVYLDRQAIVGRAYIPPEVHSGIYQARSEIRRIKDTLRVWGVTVDNHVDDEPES